MEMEGGGGGLRWKIHFSLLLNLLTSIQQTLMDKGINNGFLSIFMTNSWGITGILWPKRWFLFEQTVMERAP